MPDKFQIPKFTSEAEEAEWWFDHRQELAHAFQGAADQGRLHTGSAARIARERAATAGSTPTTTIRLDPDDISRARKLAAKRGLRYQTYLKMLLHEALKSEETKLAS
jgi:predicted DNA binding CopG/RHH family protein